MVSCSLDSQFDWREIQANSISTEREELYFVHISVLDFSMTKNKSISKFRVQLMYHPFVKDCRIQINLITRLQRIKP